MNATPLPPRRPAVRRPSPRRPASGWSASGSLAGAVGALAAATLLLAGCQSSGDGAGPDEPSTSVTTSTSVSASPSATPAPAAPRPEVNACYDLTWEQAAEPTTDTAAVPCKREHTATTYDVGTIDAVVDEHLLTVDSKHVQDQIAAACPRAFGDYVGGSEQDRRVSMVRPVWFSPTIAESDQGQDWYRCDVIVLSGNDRLTPLPPSMRDALDADGWENRYGMCGTTDPAAKGFERVICSAKHSWRAISTVDAAGAKYPGVAKLRSVGKDACEGPARSAAEDPLSVTWAYEPPTPKSWGAGQHYGYCWVPAS